tara:strand:- start:109 stop:276 length:168 start_codon:yes stop_codon:yes gene_type:complete
MVFALRSEGNWAMELNTLILSLIALASLAIELTSLQSLSRIPLMLFVEIIFPVVA